MNKMKMYNPELIYGVNLGRLDRDGRLNLPDDAIIEVKGLSWRKINQFRLQEIADEQDLVVIRDPSVEGSYNPETEDLYVGVQIKDKTKKYAEGPFDDDIVMFDINQLCRLRQDPSQLIEKMKAIGMNVRKTDFRLYGTISID